jgi:hypothetical protein
MFLAQALARARGMHAEDRPKRSETVMSALER